MGSAPARGVALYAHCGDIAGPLADDDREVVALRPSVEGRQRAILTGLVAASLICELIFLCWLLAPGHWADLLAMRQPVGIVSVAAFGAIATIEVIRLSHALVLWVFSLAAKDPEPMRAPAGLRIAILTTIVPSKEPLALVAITLAAMRSIEYEDGHVDVWILDEGDDTTVRAVAERLGVEHFSRRPHPEFNKPSGPFRACTKAGNHNAWSAFHGHEYDVVAELDPDHVPGPHFLDRTLGYFRDPDVAFVVAPQVYGDIHTGLISHGAGSQAFLFHGVLQRGGNGLGAPLLIGTNHVYRVAAWKQIGGYQDSIIEDHLTSMTLHGTVNPRTGRRWKGVYTPDVVAIGQAPSTWEDLFGQQRRWAYGVADLALHHSWRLARGLTWRQRVVYILLQSFYPGVATTWALGTLVTVAYLLGVASPPNLEPARWATLWIASWAMTIALFLWLRRLNLAAHERREFGALGALATLCAAPVYVAAVVSALLRRPLAYRVTPKGAACRPDRVAGFRLHLAWLTTVAIALCISLRGGVVAPIAAFWALVTLGALALPPLNHLLGMRRRHVSRVAKASTARVP